MLAKYVARRFLASLIVVLGVTAITLALMKTTSGSYVPGIDLNPALRPEDIARLRPQLWMGQMLILIFSVTLEQHGLPWLPSSGAFSAFQGGDLLDRVQHLILPATVLSFFYTSTWSRFIRSSMLEVLSQDYIRTARAKGMSERRVVYLHGLRNALIPLITLIGLELPGLVSGGLVVEVVFGWPGIGKLAFERALQYDYTTVMGVTFFATLLVIAGNLLADLLYGVLDPRIRYG